MTYYTVKKEFDRYIIIFPFEPWHRIKSGMLTVFDTFTLEHCGAEIEYLNSLPTIEYGTSEFDIATKFYFSRYGEINCIYIESIKFLHNDRMVTL